jgi:hypothetical protein
MTGAFSDFQNRIVSTLTDLEARRHISALDVRPSALGNPTLADVLFELNGESMLVMVADHAPETVRIVGKGREVDIAPDDLESTLLAWET